VVIVSGWRERGGRHAKGEAVDFRLDGVYAPTIAAYLRSLPRVGVGIYTHPDTQFVHVDVREPSYAWVDGSAPGVHGWERQLGLPHADKRDAGYQPEMDLPTNALPEDKPPKHQDVRFLGERLRSENTPGTH
jgi:hypothetical protein